jgi:N-acetylmuramoyl-L-alanine amidase
VSAQAPNQPGPITVLARDGRRSLPTIDVQGHQMVGLDDLANLFQLQVREDAAARAVTVTFRNQTLVLTPDQSLVSASGRLVSLPAPLTRQGRRWLVPIEFISRALAPIYDPRLDFRPGSRLLVVGDLRVPRVLAQYDDTPTLLRVTFEITPRANAVVTHEQNRLLVRIEADTLDASLPVAPGQGLLAGIRLADATTIQLDLGPRFSSHRVAPVTSRGAAAVVTVELIAAAPTTSAAPGATAPPGAPVAPESLPVLGGARPTIRTIVLDPGHGGEDNGVTGPGGALEKTVTLSVARRIKAVVEARLGLRVLLTHEDDRRIDADGRAAIANNNKADLLISLHTNGSPRPTTRVGRVNPSARCSRSSAAARATSRSSSGSSPRPRISTGRTRLPESSIRSCAPQRACRASACSAPRCAISPAPTCRRC